jgi:hypothetical protein
VRESVSLSREPGIREVGASDRTQAQKVMNEAASLSLIEPAPEPVSPGVGTQRGMARTRFEDESRCAA